MTGSVIYTVDSLAREYLDKQAACEAADGELKAIRELIIARVKEEGSYPPRATKTRVLAGAEYELRMTEPTQVSVDTKAALRFKNALIRCGCGRLFRKFFREVKTFVLVGGAQKLMAKNLPARAPRNTRSLFALAIVVDDLSPSVEVKPLQKKEAA